MIYFNHDELMLMAIYNTGTRTSLIQVLQEMFMHLTPEEDDLISLTESVLSKLENLEDEAFNELDLFPETTVES